MANQEFDEIIHIQMGIQTPLRVVLDRANKELAQKYRDYVGQAARHDYYLARARAVFMSFIDISTSGNSVVVRYGVSYRKVAGVG